MNIQSIRWFCINIIVLLVISTYASGDGWHHFFHVAYKIFPEEVDVVFGKQSVNLLGEEPARRLTLAMCNKTGVLHNRICSVQQVDSKTDIVRECNSTLDTLNSDMDVLLLRVMALGEEKALLIQVEFNATENHDGSANNYAIRFQLFKWNDCSSYTWRTFFIVNKNINVYEHFNENNILIFENEVFNVFLPLSKDNTTNIKNMTYDVKNDSIKQEEGNDSALHWLEGSSCTRILPIEKNTPNKGFLILHDCPDYKKLSILHPNGTVTTLRNEEIQDEESESDKSLDKNIIDATGGLIGICNKAYHCWQYDQSGHLRHQFNLSIDPKDQQIVAVANLNQGGFAVVFRSRHHAPYNYTAQFHVGAFDTNGVCPDCSSLKNDLRGFFCDDEDSPAANIWVSKKSDKIFYNLNLMSNHHWDQRLVLAMSRSYLYSGEAILRPAEEIN